MLGRRLSGDECRPQEQDMVRMLLKEHAGPAGRETA